LFTSFLTLFLSLFLLWACSNFCCLLFRLLPLHMFATLYLYLCISVDVSDEEEEVHVHVHNQIEPNREKTLKRRHWVRTNPQTSTVESQLCAGATRKEISEPRSSTATSTSTQAAKRSDASSNRCADTKIQITIGEREPESIGATCSNMFEAKTSV